MDLCALPIIGAGVDKVSSEICGGFLCDQGMVQAVVFSNGLNDPSPPVFLLCVCLFLAGRIAGEEFVAL